MSATSKDIEPRRFHIQDYNVLLEWSPKPRFRIAELGVIFAIETNLEGKLTPLSLSKGLETIIAMGRKVLSDFKPTDDHPLPLGELINNLVMTKNENASKVEVTIPTAALLLNESQQTVRRALDRGLLSGRKTSGGKRFVFVRSIAERRLNFKKPKAQNTSHKTITQSETPLRAKEAVRMSGLTRPTFYRVLRKLTSEELLTPVRVTPHQFGFFPEDIEKIRNATKRAAINSK